MEDLTYRVKNLTRKGRQKHSVEGKILFVGRFVQTVDCASPIRTLVLNRFLRYLAALCLSQYRVIDMTNFLEQSFRIEQLLTSNV